MKTKQFGLALIVTFLFMLNACVSDNTEKDTKEEIEITNKEISEVDLLEVFYRFPSPSVLLGTINISDLNYKPDIINPVDNLENYVSSKSKTMNVGVYVADLAYTTDFENFEESVNYFITVQSLLDELKLTAAFDTPVLNKMKNNISNVDSLATISEESYMSLVTYLEYNNREEELAVMAVGAYIECIHIAVNFVGEYSEKNPIIRQIIDLKYAVENLRDYTKQFEKYQITEDALKIINEICDIYSGFKSEKTSETKMEKKEGSKLVLSGGEKLIMTQEQFEALKSKVSEIRTEIIK